MYIDTCVRFQISPWTFRFAVQLFAAKKAFSRKVRET